MTMTTRKSRKSYNPTNQGSDNFLLQATATPINHRCVALRSSEE